MKLNSKRLIGILSLTALPFLTAVTPVNRAEAAEETTYSVCYFRDKTNPAYENWQWGLAPNNGWFSMSGHWANQRHTNTYYFDTATDEETIRQSCQQSRKYYGYDEATYELVGIYAANSSLGKNYDIRINGQALRP